MAILFEKDWDLYPTAIPDVQTKNKSFLEICKLYEKMGVKNAYFPLALINPMLQGVDPFADDLTVEQMTMISLEIEINPWYYLREVMQAPPTAGSTPRQIEANRANIALWWSWLNHIDFFLIQPRQTGKSLNTDGISTWYLHFGTMNTRASLFTKDHELIKENIARLKRIRGLMPAWLFDFRPEDTDNQKEITYVARGNRMVAKQAQANEDGARNVGRGLTAPYVHIDEIAFLRFNRISVGILLASGGAAREEAASNHLPFGNIFTTTAGDLDTDHGSFAHEILMDGAEWSEKFLDCANHVELLKMVRMHCRNKDSLLINGTFSHRQLGKTDDWLRSRISDAKQKGDDARRDFLNVWTIGGNKNPIPRELLEKVQSGVREADYIELFKSEGYMMRWYIPQEEVEDGIRDRKLVMGLDTSEVINRDNMSAVIVDISTLEVVGVCSVAETNLHQYAVWLARMLIRHPTITLIGEDKTAWKGILGYLLSELPTRGIDPGRRIYSSVVDRRDVGDAERHLYKRYTSDNSMRHYEPFIRYFGFKTTGASRELLFGNLLLESIKRTANVIRDSAIRAELGGLRDVKGRVDHAEGGHDDTLVAWLLCHWFLTYASNLSHYGIDPAMIKRKLLENELKKDWRSERTMMEQEQYRAEIEAILEEMRSPYVDYVIKARLQHRLESLYDRLDHDTLSTDAIGSMAALRDEINVKETIQYNQRALRSGSSSVVSDLRDGMMRPRRFAPDEIVMYA